MKFKSVTLQFSSRLDLSRKWKLYIVLNHEIQRVYNLKNTTSDVVMWNVWLLILRRFKVWEVSREKRDEIMHSMVPLYHDPLRLLTVGMLVRSEATRGLLVTFALTTLWWPLLVTSDTSHRHLSAFGWRWKSWKM